MVGRTIVLACGDADEFERQLASHLKCWLLTCPAGVGLATLRACLKLLLGCGACRSGVYSAGNGPAMRSAILGVMASSEEECCELVRRSTRITHTDPKAEEGAWVVAQAARLARDTSRVEPVVFLQKMCDAIEGEELREHLGAALVSLDAGHSPRQFAEARGWSRGISGYINHTVPAALYCWAASPTKFREVVTSAVKLGGDTDSVAAIAGAIAGANLGAEKLPEDWIKRLAEWPRTVGWMDELARSLSACLSSNEAVTPPPMHWPITLLRNAVFATIVLGLGFRRLLPPY